MLKSPLGVDTLVLPAAVLGAVIFAATTALAQGDSSSSSSPDAALVAPQDVPAYWNAERLKSAKPILPTPGKVGPDGLPEGSQLVSPQLRIPSAAGKSEKGEGGAPSIKLEPSAEKQLFPRQEGALSEETIVVPEMTSSFGAHFTTSRVFPDAILTVYPISAFGKLYFTDPKTNQNFQCSATVLRPRIIATAGHCVTHPSTNAAERYFYTNFLFIPAFNSGAAPFKTWTSSQQWVANAWYFSNGSVPNEQDVAMLIANDQVINGRVTKLGTVTGWVGYFTNQLANNNVTMFGYPCNLDACLREQYTNAQTFVSGGSNTYIYGSAMRGGASGGGWIQDFGVASASNPHIDGLGTNYLVAVTSYGPIATEPKYLGASNLDARFLDVLNHACGSNPGNC
jgi:V8-like Glu-specific endopeptidase